MYKLRLLLYNTESVPLSCVRFHRTSLGYDIHYVHLHCYQVEYIEHVDTEWKFIIDHQPALEIQN